jgi:hypothetical protein
MPTQKNTIVLCSYVIIKLYLFNILLAFYVCLCQCMSFKMILQWYGDLNWKWTLYLHLITHSLKNLPSSETLHQQCQKWQYEIQILTMLSILEAHIKVHTTLSCLWTSHVYNILALVPFMEKYTYS